MAQPPRKNGPYANVYQGGRPQVMLFYIDVKWIGRVRPSVCLSVCVASTMLTLWSRSVVMHRALNPFDGAA